MVLKNIMFFIVGIAVGAYLGCTVTCCIIINRDKSIVEREKFRGE